MRRRCVGDTCTYTHLHNLLTQQHRHICTYLSLCLHGRRRFVRGQHRTPRKTNTSVCHACLRQRQLAKRSTDHSRSSPSFALLLLTVLNSAVKSKRQKATPNMLQNYTVCSASSALLMSLNKAVARKTLSWEAREHIS